MLHWIKKRLYLIVALVSISSCGKDDEVSSTLVAEGFSTTIDENPSAGQELGTVDATTNLSSLSFRIESQTANGAMSVDASTGRVTVQQASRFDFETNESVEAVISASDGVKTVQVDVVITLNDIEGTITSSDFAVTVNENPDQGQVLGTIDATVDAGTLSYSLRLAQPENALFVNATTGEVVVQDPTKFDFDTNPIVSGTVEVTNQEVTSQVSVSIQLNDIDETIGFTIWSGQDMTFTKANNTNPADEANQDRIAATVWITRGISGGGLYNAFSETEDNETTSPAGTEWASGISANLSQLTFTSFRDAIEGGPKNAPGQDLVLHLIAEDVYVDVRFNTWAQGNNSRGGFSYTRSTE